MLQDTTNIQHIKNHFLEARQVLDQFLQDEDNLKLIAEAGEILVECIRKDCKIISCGNGGSMCDAMHFAEELSGRYRDERPALPAIAISDASYISCAANDFGYKYVFSRYVEALGRHGDVLLAISTSGNSENITEAIKAAHSIGMKVIGLTGKDGGKMADMCDVEIRAPFSQYADRAQEIHIKVIHSLIDFIEKGLAEERS